MASSNELSVADVAALEGLLSDFLDSRPVRPTLQRKQAAQKLLNMMGSLANSVPIALAEPAPETRLAIAQELSQERWIYSVSGVRHTAILGQK